MKMNRKYMSVVLLVVVIGLICSAANLSSAFAASDSQRNKQQQHRHAQTVVEATLDVQALPNRLGHGWVGNHRFAKCGIGCGQHRTENTCLEKRQLIEQQERSQCAKQNHPG